MDCVVASLLAKSSGNDGTGALVAKRTCWKARRRSASAR